MTEHDDERFEDDANAESLTFARRVAEIVQRIRNDRRMTQEELADRANLHRTTLGLAEKGERHLSIASAFKLAAALNIDLSEIIVQAELQTEGVPISSKRLVDPGHFENEDVLKATTGLGPEWIINGIEACYATLDMIDAKLQENGSDALARTVELANLSSMIGNILGGSLARSSSGTFVRNRPHAYPDLLTQNDAIDALEIKTALEKNRPKGHLPKEGNHLTFRYVLGTKHGEYSRDKDARGDTAWVWEVRIGHLTASDYDLSNTEGDSGKTAVIKTESFKQMTRLLYVPDFMPYSKNTGPYGSP